MLIFSLRKEARVSGESATFRLVEEVLRELAIPCERWESETGFQPVPQKDRLEARPTMAAAHRLRALTRIAAANTTDVLMVKIPTAAQLPFAVWATRRFRGRLIFWIDGLLWRPLSAKLTAALFAAEPLLTTARALINNPLWPRLAGGRALEIVVASHTQQAELAPLLPRAKIHVIPNGTPGIAAPAPATRRALTLGYIGHSYVVKGVRDILEMHRELRRHDLAPPLVVAFSELGGQAIREEFRRAGATVLGVVEKAEFYAQIDVLIAPYWAGWGTQTFPNILLEALQYGVPVLTTDIPVCRELFPDDLAIFVPPNDPGALADRVARMIRGDITLPSPERLRAHFDAHYSREKIAAGWRALLRGSSSAIVAPAHD